LNDAAAAEELADEPGDRRRLRRIELDLHARDSRQDAEFRRTARNGTTRLVV
jgi:hypothetical protein